MVDKLRYRLETTTRATSGGVLKALMALVLAMMGLYGTDALAQVGGRGPDPIPAFTQDTGGGGGEGVQPDVNFDPSTSYLPSPPVGQTYQYTAIWDFGDGTPLLTVGPTDAVTALDIVNHVFPVPPTSAFVDRNTPAGGLYTITLKINVTVFNQNNVASPGPSAMTTGKVRSASVNYGPTWSLVNNSSPSTGTLPYQINVDCSKSYDEDGYVIWAAIDWGDGSSDLLTTLPPSTAAIASLHNYTSPGTYNITLSLIDNGRMDVDTVLDPTPAANDPAAALTAIKALQQKLIDTNVLFGALDPNTGISIFNAAKYAPILRQEFLQVQVLGNLTVVKGSFVLDFTTPGQDSFDATFLLNSAVSSVATAQVKIFFGDPNLPGSLVLQQFTTDLKGNYFNKAQGLKFSIAPRQHYMRFQIKTGALQVPFNITNVTVHNGFVDIPMTIQITGNGSTTALSSRLRFVYNATAGASGKGKNPRSTLVGN
ncbi:MAG: hypothetical protein WCT04_03550 [Planctomycetota bacterium]